MTGIRTRLPKEGRFEHLATLRNDEPLQRIEQLAFVEHRKDGISFAFKDRQYLETSGRHYRTDDPLRSSASISTRTASMDISPTWDLCRSDFPSTKDRRTVRRKVGTPKASGGGIPVAEQVWAPWDGFDRSRPSQVAFCTGLDVRARQGMVIVVPPATGQDAAAQVIELLGVARSDPKLGAVLAELGPPVETDRGDETSLDYAVHGLSLIFDDAGILVSVQLFAEGRDGFRQFGGPLPRGLTFDADRSKVRQRLGAPTASGGGQRTLLYERAAQWDRYDEASESLHIEYGVAGISLVTLMSQPPTLESS